MKSFEERRRDPFITEEAYAEHLKNTEDLFSSAKYVEDRARIDPQYGPGGARQISFTRVRRLIEGIWAHYSAGGPLEGLRARVKYAFEDLQRDKEAFPERNFMLWEPDTYYYTMLLTSWTVLFDLPECLDILAGYISRDPDDGEDCFVHTVFHALGIPDFPGKQAGLLHENPYGILYDALAGSKEDQQKAMQTYLTRWYESQSIEGCYWRERHSFNPPMHLGYWAFETGMLTVINDLDDSGYRDMPYYPRDMVDYCKEQGWHKKIAERVQAIRGE